jgi:hypothetical protein
VSSAALPACPASRAAAIASRWMRLPAVTLLDHHPAVPDVFRRRPAHGVASRLSGAPRSRAFTLASFPTRSIPARTARSWDRSADMGSVSTNTATGPPPRMSSHGRRRAVGRLSRWCETRVNLRSRAKPAQPQRSLRRSTGPGLPHADRQGRAAFRRSEAPARRTGRGRPVHRRTAIHDWTV